MENGLMLPGECSLTHWEIPADIEESKFLEILPSLESAETAIKWYRGEWMLFGEERFEERMSQLYTGCNMQKKTLENERWVAKAVHVSLRRKELSWTHHRVVAPLSPSEQAEFLEKAVVEGLTTKELEQAVRCRHDAVPKPKAGSKEEDDVPPGPNGVDEQTFCCELMKADVADGIVSRHGDTYYISPSFADAKILRYCFECGASL